MSNKLEFIRSVEIMVVVNNDVVHRGAIFLSDESGTMIWKPPSYVSFTVEELETIIHMMKEANLK